ncbi:MAG TPA: DUF86 domain-containing protein [Vicinamibacteria bacterium]|nr:DUF86 domain-containing protein [Vicinamibacteria bacterium]
MPLRAEVIRKKLLEIDQTTGRLRSWMPMSLGELEQDLRLQWAVERGLQLAAEALFDTGNHILASAFQESVDEYAQIPKRLAVRGVLKASTASRLESLAGFRNILVHDYAEVDLKRVHAGLQRLDDFDAFVADVEEWLRSKSAAR